MSATAVFRRTATIRRSGSCVRSRGVKPVKASDTPRQFAVVTGASTGIGYELAKCCAKGGFGLLVAADEPAIYTAADEFRALGVTVQAVEADLATIAGVDELYGA